MPETWTHPPDATGTLHPATTAPARIVCLVPSITELLFDLDLGDQIVGRTRYCVHPAKSVGAIPSVGGTKKVKHSVIRALRPSHIIVNIDENPRPMAEQLAGYIPHVIVTHPNEPLDNLALFRLLGGIFHRHARAEALCQRFTEAHKRLQEAARRWPRRRVVYLIWRKPWMAVGRDTYIANTLALAGWETLPEVTEPRYPTLKMTARLLKTADRVLFSTEPYPFKTADLERFARSYHYPHETLALIDGEMISWFGSRAISGLDYLLSFAGMDLRTTADRRG